MSKLWIHCLIIWTSSGFIVNYVLVFGGIYHDSEESNSEILIPLVMFNLVVFLGKKCCMFYLLDLFTQILKNRAICFL